MKRSNKKLVFHDLDTGEIWENDFDSPWLVYLNFKSDKRPLSLRVNQSTRSTDVNGHHILIKCVYKTQKEQGAL